AVKPTSEMDRGEKPFIQAWGTNTAPIWSPDGTKIAFSSNRGDHSFIAVYDMPTRTMKYMAPSVDHDTSPMWAADSKSLMFIRRPGTPFGQQTQAGSNGIGLPAGPAAAAAAARGGGGGANARGGGGGRRGGGGGGDQGGAGAGPTPLNQLPNANSPGL